MAIIYGRGAMSTLLIISNVLVLFFFAGLSFFFLTNWCAASFFFLFFSMEANLWWSSSSVLCRHAYTGSWLCLILFYQKFFHSLLLQSKTICFWRCSKCMVMYPNFGIMKYEVKIRRNTMFESSFDEQNKTIENKFLFHLSNL